MDIIKSYSRRSLLLILVFMAIFAGACAAVLYFLGRPHFIAQLTQLTASQLPSAEQMTQVTALLDSYILHIVPTFAAVSLLFGILLWLVLRRTAQSAITGGSPAKSPAKDKKTAAPTQKQNVEEMRLRNQRLFLHLLAVLQREGRLVDFLQEDLEMYEDEQIGTAVRNIHGSCRKTLSKSLSMKPIISGDEGEEITVDGGFDPDAIKLTGRVTGEPPFKGTIRHKGWRTAELEMPDLSAIKDPTIIYPAEVEID